MHKKHDVRWPLLAAFVSLAIVLTGAIATGASASKGQGVCASIDRYHLEKQMNHRAAAILAACGRAPATSTSFSALDELTPSSPNVYGGGDKNLIQGSGGDLPPRRAVREPNQPRTATH